MVLLDKCGWHIKEQIAQDLERYGDTRVVSVEELTPYRQMQLR